MEEAHQRLKGIRSIIKRLSGSFLLSAAFCFFTASPAAAIDIISDEETEVLIAHVAQPLFKAAGIPFDRNKIYIVNDSSLNAFVSDGNRLFVHTGTITAAENVNELAGVIAHETGHIQGGHILRQKIKNQAMREVTLASAILAGTAAAASGRGDVAMAVLLGSQSSALTHYTRYRTEEERNADEAAVNLLAQTGQSPAGILRFMKKIAKQNNLNGIEETPYFRTHPVTSERIGFFEEAVKKSDAPQESPYDKDLQLVKAKLYAFLNTPQQTARKYPTGDKSEAALYAQGISAFKQLKLKEALAKMDKLIATAPDNPYFKEMKAQIYLETGQIKPARKEYEQALKQRPESVLLQLSLAQAMLEDSLTPAELERVIRLLNQAQIKRPSAWGWLLTSRAYGQKNDLANANYAAAEYSYAIGAAQTAKRQIAEARKASPNAKLRLKLDDLEARLQEILKND